MTPPPDSAHSTASGGGVKTLTILGSTGSVGKNTLEIVRQNPSLYRVAGLAAGSKTDVLREQIEEFSPKAVYTKDSAAAAELSKAFAGKTRVFTDAEGLPAFSAFLAADVLVAASSGTTALLPVLDAIEKGKRIALANKEILVMAGSLVMAALKKYPKASLIPVDSEHSAVFQCLQGNPMKNVRRIILTGSGGPLREMEAAKFSGLSKETVINHPKWKMGKKISVDSATLMNKGLELIEARWLFDVPVENIDVLIHPEAIIHSMIEFHDGAVLAQMGIPDMKLPIRYAVDFPDRNPAPEAWRVDFARLSRLSFALPDRAKFPCLDIAMNAARKAGSAPCVLSAADEVAVEAYLDDKIGFIEIPRIIEKVLSSHAHVADPDLKQIRSIHEWATEETRRLC